MVFFYGYLNFGVTVIANDNEGKDGDDVNVETGVIVNSKCSDKSSDQHKENCTRTQNAPSHHDSLKIPHTL